MHPAVAFSWMYGFFLLALATIVVFSLIWLRFWRFVSCFSLMNVSANTILNGVRPYVLCLCVCVGDGVTFYHYSSSELVFAVALFARCCFPLLFHGKALCEIYYSSIVSYHRMSTWCDVDDRHIIQCNALTKIFSSLFCECHFNLCILFCFSNADHSYESRIPNENGFSWPKRTERFGTPVFF